MSRCGNFFIEHFSTELFVEGGQQEWMRLYDHVADHEILNNEQLKASWKEFDEPNSLSDFVTAFVEARKEGESCQPKTPDALQAPGFFLRYFIRETINQVIHMHQTWGDSM
jgi:hypothetical protein